VVDAEGRARWRLGWGRSGLDVVPPAGVQGAEPSEAGVLMHYV